MNPRATDETLRHAQVGLLCIVLGVILGMLVAVDHLFWQRALAAPLLLMGLSLGLLAFYWLHRAQWWSILPAGVLLTLAAVEGLHRVYPQVRDDWLFFAGLALTFLAAYAAGGGRPQTGWAWAAAAVAGLISLLSLGSLLEYVPLLLVAAGLVLRLRAPRRE